MAVTRICRCKLSYRTEDKKSPTYTVVFDGLL